jgi:hypothetical protein
MRRTGLLIARMDETDDLIAASRLCFWSENSLAQMGPSGH